MSTPQKPKNQGARLIESPANMIEKIGKFEITELLGRGSMGEVYLGRDPVLGREVAVKTIAAASSLAAEAKERFSREAQATAALNHPHIVTVFEFGEVQDSYYLVMEYVKGKDLQTLLHEDSLSRIECMEVLAQIGEALAFAHEKGIIHRDVKPSNILVTRFGKKLQAKLTDFGVAMINSSNLTQQGTWMGTVSYMAPEYLDTGKASPSSDLFALGVILYEALSGGQKPFIGDSTTAVLNAILRSSMRPLSPTERQGLPLEALVLLRKSLERNPQERYQSGEQFAEALREVKQAFEKPRAHSCEITEETYLPPQGVPAPATPLAPVVPLSSAAPPDITQEIDTKAPVRPPTNPLRERPIVVGKGQQATCFCLKPALRQAKPGTIITILPGIYKDPLVIDKDVILQGEGALEEIILEGGITSSARTEFKNLTLCSAEGIAFHVQAGQATLHRCRITAKEGCAIQLERNANAHLDHCQIEGNGPMVVSLKSGATAHIEESSIQGESGCLLDIGSSSVLQVEASWLENTKGIGIRIRQGGQLQAESMEIRQAPAGCIELCPEARLQLSSCNIRKSSYAGLIALEKSNAILENCVFSGHHGAGVHALDAIVQMKQCTITENPGYGLTIMEKAQLNMDNCVISKNSQAGLRIHHDGSAQLKNCRIADGLSLGIICAKQGRGVLESCEISGNAKTGARVEPGGSLLLMKCVLRDGQDTGLILFEDAEATLEECVVHRNARGGILLAKDAMDPHLRGDNQIHDQLVRMTDQGPVKVAPVKKH